MTQKKAFTLLELMVAMGIIAILAAMSVFGISLVQQSLRNTQRRKNLEDTNLALQQYFERNSSYPTWDATTGLVFRADGAYIEGTQVVKFTGAGTAAPTGELTTNNQTAYCYQRQANGATYGLGVDLEGDSTDFSFQLGEPTVPDCTTTRRI